MLNDKYLMVNDELGLAPPSAAVPVPLLAKSGTSNHDLQPSEVIWHSVHSHVI
jgi:hypothetical protein